ncbi:MAG TPA: transglycosylase domain-containing protein [Verrucomicrobiae bacterium]|nr:transglycosylase domain-containing protein [Verrucomicrobiae bacterium]
MVAGLLVLLFAVTLGIGPAAALTRVLGALPTPNPLPTDTLVFAAGGAEIADLHVPGQSRIPVRLSQVAPGFLHAVIATEDRSFWTGGSIDWPRLVAAALHDLLHHGTLEGASTIPEQLAKLRYLTDNRSITYKVREILLGQQLSATESRHAILDQYVNDVYFGDGATGIEAASLTYFGVSARRLTLPESTLLAGLLPAPSALDPLLNLAGARVRQRVVVDSMVAAGDLSRSRAESVLGGRLPLRRTPATTVDRAPYFIDHVRGWLAARFGTRYLTMGLRVQTPLRLGLERLAQRVVTSTVAGGQAMHMSDGALVAIEPRSGDVIAYVGGAGPGVPGGQIDMAAAPRQPGSTAKLVTYSAALSAHAVTMTTPVLDAPLTLPRGGPPGGRGPFVVHDYEDVYQGVVPVQVALGNSLNVAAVRVELRTGIEKVVRLARRMGITTLARPAASYGPSLTLGGYPVPLWETAQVGSVLATGGLLHRARFVTRVTGMDGDTLYAAPARARRVLSARAAYVMNVMLSRNANRLLAFGPATDLVVPGRTVAVKTGTSNDLRDNLAVGWTPTLVTATWVGNADDQPMYGGGINGISGAASMWNAFMVAAMARTPNRYFPTPAGLTVDGTGATRAYYLPGTGPSTTVLGIPGPAAGGVTTNVRYRGICRYWVYDGGNYYWCGSGASSLPGDPGPQPAPPAPAPPAPRVTTAGPPPGPGQSHRHGGGNGQGRGHANGQAAG